MGKSHEYCKGNRELGTEVFLMNPIISINGLSKDT
jgi:hypothetical protein